MKRLTMGRVALVAVAVGVAVVLVIAADKNAPASTTRDAAATAGTAPPTSTTTPASTTTPPPTTTTTAPSTVSAQESQDLAEDSQEALKRTVSSAQLGMEVYDRATGTVVTSVDPDTQFASMSVVKLLIAIDIVARNGDQVPDSGTASEVTQMLSTSDDDIASALWDDGGQGSIITRDAALMGLTETEPPDDPGEWGATEITAHDMVIVYNYVLDKLPSAARDFLYSAMYHASEIAADGTNQYFGIPDALPGTTWAIKQGWGSNGPYAYYNTTGVVGSDTRYVVILLSSAPLGDYDVLPQALTSATSALSSVFG